MEKIIILYRYNSFPHFHNSTRLIIDRRSTLNVEHEVAMLWISTFNMKSLLVHCHRFDFGAHWNALLLMGE